MENKTGRKTTQETIDKQTQIKALRLDRIGDSLDKWVLWEKKYYKHAKDKNKRKRTVLMEFDILKVIKHYKSIGLSFTELIRKINKTPLKDEIKIQAIERIIRLFK
jgi:hypothetical protein